MIRRVISLFLVFFIAVTVLAQSRRERGPRALAVVDVLGKGHARLTPVAILVDGKFYDANLYNADPRPLSVDSGVIYDVLHEGKLVGTFTVGTAADVNGVWLADGRIKPIAPENAPAEVSLGKKTAPKPSGDDEDKPPVLRRPEAKPSTPPGDAPSASAPHADNPPTAPPKPAETQTANASDEEGRPTLKRGRPEPRTAEITQPKPAKPSTSAQATAATKPTARTESSALVKQTYTAISDATGGEYRPYEYTIAPQDRDRYIRDVTGMALEALTRFSSTHPTAGVPAPGALQDVKLTAYDLDANNMPTMVLSATKAATPRSAKGSAQPVPALQMFVTVVARTDIYGNIRRLFTQVTDASHLDAVPRLELVDAVDAEATGRGQLLFRQINDTGATSFTLYRVGADQLWPLFEGSSGR